MLITIGAFDGFHRGHKILLDACRDNAVNKNDWCVITFWPHPGIMLGKIQSLLFTIEERNLISRALNIPEMIILKFDDELKNMTPSEFWKLIKNKISVDGVVMGCDFHFGVGRGGTAQKLSELAKNDGIEKIFIIDLIDKKHYSSSKVRQNILSGDVKSAADILGYNWFIMNNIISGNQRGRTMKFPTANLNLSSVKILPAYGVYAAAVLLNNSWYCGAVSIGNNPTFKDIKETRAEVHILNFSGDLYGENMAVFFLDRVRGLIKFDNKNALAEQISLDIKKCMEIYENDFNRFSLSSEFKRAFTV